MIIAHVVTAPGSGGALLARLPNGPCFWMSRELSQCVGHRYVLRCPNWRAALRTATMWGGKHEHLQVSA